MENRVSPLQMHPIFKFSSVSYVKFGYGSHSFWLFRLNSWPLYWVSFNFVHETSAQFHQLSRIPLALIEVRSSGGILWAAEIDKL